MPDSWIWADFVSLNVRKEILNLKVEARVSADVRPAEVPLSKLWPGCRLTDCDLWASSVEELEETQLTSGQCVLLSDQQARLCSAAADVSVDDDSWHRSTLTSALYWICPDVMSRSRYEASSQRLSSKWSSVDFFSKFGLQALSVFLSWMHSCFFLCRYS